MVAKTLKTLHSLDTENNSDPSKINKLMFTGFTSFVESSGSTTEPSNGMGEDCRVTRNKRKATINLESPRKRQRGASEPTEVAVEAVTAKGIKRKAIPEREIPKKRLRSHSHITGASEPTEVAAEELRAKGTKRKASTEIQTPSKKQRGGNTDEPTKVSVEDVGETESKEETCAEQLPATETPWTTRMESGCDLSLSSSDSSASKQTNGSTSDSVKTSRANFEAKYLQLDKLGEGGFGSVYAGNRKTDNLPVAIKHIPEADVEGRPMVLNGKTYMVPTEVLLMLRVAGGPESVGKSTAVSLLDWYDLDQEVLLVMERPVPAVDLLNYLNDNDGPLEEDQAKNIMKQLVEAAIKMHSEGVFHRDLKAENVLVETGSDVPQVRVIDFGCSCFVKKRPYRCFSGTFAYAPPEFYIQGAYEAGPTTVWQLAALLYEMLDGYKQFTTSKFLRLRIKFMSELHFLKVSQDCQDLLRMCLAVNPKERTTLEQMQQHAWFK